MSIVVDHDRRRRVILATALDLFAEEGYPGVTFQKIAVRCGIARTGMYRYFDSKREVFDSAIRQKTDELLDELTVVSLDEALPVAERLQEIMARVVETMYRMRTVLKVILEYLVRQQHEGDDISRKVRRHTVGMRLLLRQLIREGVRKGEFVPMRPGDAADMFFSLLEATVMEVTVSGMLDRRHVRRIVSLAIRQLEA